MGVQRSGLPQNLPSVQASAKVCRRPKSDVRPCDWELAFSEAEARDHLRNYEELIVLLILELIGGTLIVITGMYVYKLNKRAVEEDLPGPDALGASVFLVVIGGAIILDSVARLL